MSHGMYIIPSRNRLDGARDSIGALVPGFGVINARVISQRLSRCARQRPFDRNLYVRAPIRKQNHLLLTHVAHPQEELDEVFNRLSENQNVAERPAGLAPSWPPSDHVGGPYAKNGDYPPNGFGARFDDVILELQLPERIVCKACNETTGQCVCVHYVAFTNRILLYYYAARTRSVSAAHDNTRNIEINIFRRFPQFSFS